MNIYSIRGATTIDENTKEDILRGTEELLQQMIEKNNINKDDIVSMIFTATTDITKAYPAVATRNIGITSCPVMCVQELFVENSLAMCIRVMITATLNIDKSEVQHIYLRNAMKLRPDISLKDLPFAVAIDGPVGTGKSTVSRMVAKELGFLYIDTGAMFRTIALFCANNRVDCEDNYEVSEALKNINIDIKFEDNMQQIYLNDKKVTDEIRTQEISSIASKIAKYQEVRKKLLELQRNIADGNKVVMDGRDVGTVVLPHAEVKIYLEADVEERARRRYEELSARNRAVDFDEIKQSIIERDERDKNRKLSPLKKADDAIEIDTTYIDAHGVTDEIIRIVKGMIG